MDYEDNYPYDLEDDPYRTCELCDIKYHEEFGNSCEICDIWICNNCWPEHNQHKKQNQNGLTTIGT